jgi:hypothetical protein
LLDPELQIFSCPGGVEPLLTTKEKDMLLTVQARELQTTPASLFSLTADKFKWVFKDFNEDEDGMNTVEAIILLFVAAIVLLVFFTLIWPLIRDTVMEKLNSLFGQSGT